MTHNEISNMPVCWNCAGACFEGTDRSTKVAPPRKLGTCSNATSGNHIRVEGKLEVIGNPIEHHITSQTPCNVYKDPEGEIPAFIAR